MKNRHSVFRAFLLAAFLLIYIDGVTRAAGGLEETRSPVAEFFINGRITSGGADLNGVTITVTGTTSGATTSSGSGIYWFFSLPSGGTYTITPSLPNYVFTPPSRTITNLNADLSNINFNAFETCLTPNCRTNGRIAFVRSGDIYTSNQAGADLINLTSHAAADGEPVFSPDGKKIMFTSNRDGNEEIYTMNAADGGNLVRLTTNSASDSNAAFSPDGTKILFATNRDANSEIYMMNADGSNQIRLTTNAIFDGTPSFSPDGSKIVFARQAVGQSQGTSIFTMNADGSNQVRLTDPTAESATDQSPSFSPDGSRIMFTRFNFGSFYSPILLMNADGSNQTVITSQFSRNYTPAFAPNGLRIIYTILAASTQVRYDVMTRSLVDGQEKLIAANGTNADWQPVRAVNTRTPFDFDGDRFADISVFRPSNGTWYFRQNNGGYSEAQFGATGDAIVPADYDGDGKTDLAVFRRGDDSTWYILQSSNNQFRAVQWGARNIEQPLLFDTPVPADYDGDGKADLAVWRLTDALSEPARFLILQSSNSAARIDQWGNSSDRPVPADYDGDERADLAVYRGGAWYILQSVDNSMRAAQFGLGSDKTVPADYDGDGKADLAVYRPSNGYWYLINSANNSFAAAQFGTAEDKPAPADFDGDGKADLAVFRPSNGTWYLLRSTAGFTGAQFGINTDLPTPSAFVR